MAGLIARFTPADPNSQYGYIPTEWICIMFIVLFSISTVLHLYQAMRSRLWWLLPTVCLAGLGEIIGWSGRLWSHFNPNASDPFFMQITTTIISPTPFVAALFVILGRIIGQLGPCYSRLSPKWYSIIFCSCDVVALVIQSLGGATASSGSSNSNSSSSNAGGNIMLGGIIFQLVSITVYSLLAMEFLVRYVKDKPLRTQYDLRLPHMPRNTKLMVIGLCACTVFIYIRSIYRTIELTDGWTGEIIQTQWLFNVFDGAMVVLAMYTLNFFHPGRLLGTGGMKRSGDSVLLMQGMASRSAVGVDVKAGGLLV